MKARMKNPVAMLPNAMKAIMGLSEAAKQGGVPPRTLELVHLRASQINGCSACVYGGAHAAKSAGESDARLWSLAAWREAPYFDDAERAALALAEALTRLSDRGSDAVPDALWEELTRHYDERARASLILWIATTNLFNRLNASVKEPAGATWA